MTKKKANYYVVWQGREPGIYGSWSECEAQVKGVAARYKGFLTREEADQAWAQGAPAKTEVTSKTKEKVSVDKPKMPYLAVDAACSGNPGKMEFRGVIGDTGAEAFRRGPYEGGTNNIGEFLAIVLGLAYLQQQHLDWPMYSDSRTAIAWVREKHCKTQLDWNEKNQDLLLMVRKAEKWLHEHQWTTHIMKWDTPQWGEIPADFGRK